MNTDSMTRPGFDAHIEPGDAFERYFAEAHKYGATREGALKHWATVLSPESRAAWSAGVVPAAVARKVRASAPDAMAEALLRAHCDLRWLAGYCGKGSVALSENAAVGFDHAWERSAQNRMLSGKPSATAPDVAHCGVDFGTAIAFMRRGIRVQRAGWNCKGMWLRLVPADAGVYPDATVPVDEQYPRLAFIEMKTADDKLVPWQPSQADVLAEDWLSLDGEASR